MRRSPSRALPARSWWRVKRSNKTPRAARRSPTGCVSSQRFRTFLSSSIKLLSKMRRSSDRRAWLSVAGALLTTFLIVTDSARIGGREALLGVRVERRPQESRERGSSPLHFHCSAAQFFGHRPKNRGDRMAIELFSRQLREWPGHLCLAANNLR